MSCPLRNIQALETSNAALLTFWAAASRAIRSNWSTLAPAPAGSLSSRQSKSTAASGDRPRRQGRVAQCAEQQGMSPGAMSPSKCIAKGGRGGDGRGGGGRDSGAESLLAAFAAVDAGCDWSNAVMLPGVFPKNKLSTSIPDPEPKF